MTEPTCESCGQPVELHEQHARFRLPDPVLADPAAVQRRGSWLSHADPEGSVMMQVPGIGAFIRALLPIRLTGGFTLTYGVWVAVQPDHLQHAFAVWWEPGYRNLRLSGWLGNAISPWGLLAAPVDLAVLHPDHTPYCVASPDPELALVLSQEWPHADILAAASTG